MTDDIFMRDDKILQRRLDLVKIDIGDETIDGGIDASRLRAMEKPGRRG